VKLLAEKLTVVRPVLPSAGLEAWYYGELKKLIDRMAKSMEVHIRAAWNADEPDIGMGADASPTVRLRRAMSKWGRRWLSKFDESALTLAQRFAARSTRHADVAQSAVLKQAGFGINFKPTLRSVEAYRLVLTENVNLIKNLPREYIHGIQQAVWQSVMKGQDMGDLTKTLQERYGMSLRRAALISRDQNRKATAVMENVRRQELGITHAIWLHSHAVKTPRPSHLAFSGKVYELKKGAYLDGKWVWPGTEINCRCLSRIIIPGYDDPKNAKVIERERLLRV